MSLESTLFLLIASQIFALGPALAQVFKIESKFVYDSAEVDAALERQRKAVQVATDALAKSARLRELQQKFVECSSHNDSTKKLERSQIIREIVRVSNSMLVAHGIVVLSNSKSNSEKKPSQ
jgi:hypothetical protein